MLGHFVYSYSRARTILCKMNGTEFFLVFFCDFLWTNVCGVSKMVFSDEKCCFIIEAYFTNNKSFKTVCDVFRVKYGQDYSDPDSSINRVVRCFQHEHTILRKKREWKTVDDYYRQTRRGEGNRCHAAC